MTDKIKRLPLKYRGIETANFCDVCGKARNARDHNRARCSRIRQRRGFPGKN